MDRDFVGICVIFYLISSRANPHRFAINMNNCADAAQSHG